MKKNDTSKKWPARGDAFVAEATGSATQINLDGQWKQDFTDHDEKIKQEQKQAGM